MNVDVADPTRRGQDLFVLSKGHAVAALASIYAELGYFDPSVLRNSRSYASILNGHPGPILPGVHLATGPMGQGFGVAQGFAIAGKSSPRFDAYCLTGDGELQEGPIWEAVMYAGQKHLDNLCVMVDRNNGQLDIANRMVFPMPELEAVFASFDWEVHSVDATQYDGRLRGARGVPLRTAQRQADRDHLSRHQGPRRAVRFPEQAQGHGPGSADRAGDSRFRRRSAAIGSRNSTSSMARSATSPTAPRCRSALIECARHDASGRRPRLAGEAVADRG